MAAHLDKRELDYLIEDAKHALQKSFQKEPDLLDIAWRVSINLITKNPRDCRGILFQQALFLHRTGRDYGNMREHGYTQDLKRYKRQGVKKVTILTAKESSCDNCRKLENQIFAIEEALERKILPCQECTFEKGKENSMGWCRCLYTTPRFGDWSKSINR